MTQSVFNLMDDEYNIPVLCPKCKRFFYPLPPTSNQQEGGTPWEDIEPVCQDVAAQVYDMLVHGQPWNDLGWELLGFTLDEPTQMVIKLPLGTFAITVSLQSL